MATTEVNVSASSAKGSGFAWRGLAVLCAAQLMIVLDASIVNVALPSIRTELGLSDAALQAVVTTYALTFGGLLLLGGRLGDLYGRRRLLLVSLLGFAVASFVGGLAGTGTVLLAARAAQGVAAAVAAPAVLSLLTALFAEGAVRDRALGVYGAVAAGGFAVGVLLGGILTQTLGWRWVMFVNVPIGLLTAAAIPSSLPETPRLRGHLDLLGGVTVTAGLGAIVFALSTIGESGRPTASTIVALFAGVALLVAFIAVERRAAAPLLRLGLLADRVRSGAYVVALAWGATLAPTLYLITLYLQDRNGYSPIRTGLAFLPLALIVAGSTQLVARASSRSGVTPGLIAGSVLMVAGTAVLLALPEEGTTWPVVQGGLLLTGLGVAFLIVNVASAVTAGVAENEQGVSAGLFNSAQQVGSALGLAIAVALQVAVSGESSAAIIGYRAGLLAGVGFAVLALLVSTLVIHRSARRVPAA